MISFRKKKSFKKLMMVEEGILRDYRGKRDRAPSRVHHVNNWEIRKIKLIQSAANIKKCADNDKLQRLREAAAAKTIKNQRKKKHTNEKLVKKKQADMTLHAKFVEKTRKESEKDDLEKAKYEAWQLTTTKVSSKFSESEECSIKESIILLKHLQVRDILEKYSKLYANVKFMLLAKEKPEKNIPSVLMVAHVYECY